MDEGGPLHFSDEKFCMDTNDYNNNHTSVVPTAQEFYMETHDFNNNPTSVVPMTQETYMEAPLYYHTNPTTMVPTAQEHYTYMGTTYYNNNHTAMSQGSYMETPYYSKNTCITVVPTAQDYYMYMGTTYYNNTGTTVVPLTQEWVSRLQINMNDGYGPSMIMEKFLTSLPECKRETPANQESSEQECNPEVGENEMRSASESCKRSEQMTRSEMTDPEVAPPGDIGQDCSNDSVKSPQYHNHTSDVEKGLQETYLHHNLDIDDWIILKGSEAGSVYYSDDEEDIPEEMTGDSTGPDGDSMEERQAFPASSVSGRLVDKLSDYITEKIQLLDQIELDHHDQSVSGLELEGLEEIQFLDQIELDHQSLGTGDPEEIQLLDFIDHQSDDAEEKFQLLDPTEMLGLCVWQNSVPEHEVVTTNRLSWYDLYHGPTHRARSPSCPLIGARGDSRERSMYSEDTAPPSLQHMAAQDHRVDDIAVRTAKGKTVKPAAHKAHCYRSPTAPLVNLPLPSCPCLLLLMGLASILVATIDAKQKLGKLLGKSCQGQPHYRQPHTQQKTSYKYPRWKTCLLCLRLPWQLTRGIRDTLWLPLSLCTYQCEPQHAVLLL
ncbi:Hypp7998 [Branchiostoma lanceolatum]|uniref:Hypp7998 protein n=1 Tax=Branchiostoma lanceolatum TaxID=7740 RepID=A0A8K0EGL9_BRALA|nr:Hypp7998 [Branchiostoma lanceolatum]